MSDIPGSITNVYPDPEKEAYRSLDAHRMALTEEFGKEAVEKALKDLVTEVETE